MYTIYSRDNCNFCDQAEELLKSKNLDYSRVKLVPQVTEPYQISLKNFQERYPSQRTVPFITKDGDIVGGFQELQLSLV